VWASARTPAAPANVRELPAEPGRLGVVVDARRPDADTDRLLAGLLPVLAVPGRGGSLRLVLSSAADRYGRAVARRFGLDVIAAEDQVAITPYGHGLVRSAGPWAAPDPGVLAQWRRCLPDGECRPAGVLYPSPPWETALPARLESGLAAPAMAHRVPAGLALGLPGRSGAFDRAAYAVWPDPERLTVVVDQAGPPEAMLNGLARLLSTLPLDHTDGIRLYWPRAAAGSTGQAVRQLARRCGIDVIAPAADLEDSGGFGAVSHGPLGAAPWLRFTPDGDTQLQGSLYPVPGWERTLADVELDGIAGDLVLEHVAAGICLYRPVPEENGLAATARSLLPDPRRMSMIVSGSLPPGEAAERLPQVLRRLPMAARGVRLVMPRAGAGGPDSLAQSLADAAGGRIVAPVGQWTATPDGRLRILGPEGRARAAGWASFTPRPQAAAVPPPTSGSGTREHPAAVGPDADTGPARGRHAAEEDAGPLAEGMRVQIPAGQERTPEPQPPEPQPPVPPQAALAQQPAPPPAETRDNGPRDEPPPTPEPPPPRIEPQPQPPAVAATGHPLPDAPAPEAMPAALSLVPRARAHRSSEEERQEYRKSAGRYQVHAVTVRRMLTQRPGLRASAPADSDDALVTDFAAILDFLEADPAALREALRAPGPSRYPWAACVVSGLRRLPSFTGPVFTSAQRNGQLPHGYPPGQLIIEPAFVFATSAPQIILDGDVEYIIWSKTAKRIAALAPEAGRDEVIFPAGTAFRVLHAEPGENGPMRFFLSEAAPDQKNQDNGGQFDERELSLLERLNAAVAVRDGLAADDRIAARRPGGPGPPLGVDRDGTPFQITEED
jgi:hypothetical protein